MCFLSGEWEFVLVCAEDDRKVDLFVVVICHGSRCKILAFTSESSPGACTAVSVVCLKYFYFMLLVPGWRVLPLKPRVLPCREYL